MTATPPPRHPNHRMLPNINERIRYPKIRLIDVDGTQLGIMSPREALALAQERELDLVLISEKADPPVCRIMDYGKYKFQQEKKAREAKKKQQTIEVKEVKMRYNIDEHDYQVRVNQARRFLKRGQGQGDHHVPGTGISAQRAGGGLTQTPGHRFARGGAGTAGASKGGPQYDYGAHAQKRLGV